MKKNKIILALTILTVGLCTSCSGADFLSSLIPSSCTKSSIDEKGDTPTDADVTLSKYWENARYEILPSLGEQKMLVIPVSFQGDNLTYETKTGSTTTSNTAKYVDISKENIYNTFFGNSDDTGWESVSSYYYKSSYGKLNITGEVSEPYVCDINIAALAAGTDDKLISYDEVTWYVLREAVEFVREECPDINLSDYDIDDDGYIDSVFLVYNVVANALPKTIDKKGLLWAFTYWDYNITPSLSKPVASVYGWASQSFILNDDYEKADAHVYIHETGHILGLDDYYSYDSNDYAAIGGLDMMDSNIGDHDAYSKSLLEWCTPNHVTEEKEYTLRPFESSGDCLVIRPSWKGSLLDEYLIIEYYTPTGLNSADASIAYNNKYKMYTEAGIKVLHVDSRLAEINQDGNGNQTVKGYSTKLINSFNNITKQFFYTEFACSNTTSKSHSGNKLISIVDGGVVSETFNRLKIGATSYANDSFLFHSSSNNKFGIKGGRYENYKFNCGVTIDYGFSITNMNSEGATLSFTKI